MQYTLADLTDRTAILWLKATRLPADNGYTWREYWKTQDAMYDHASESLTHNQIYLYLRDLCKVNSEIWDLEAAIRQGKEGELGLEEVGRRALAIRDKNKERIAIKNNISECVGDFIEVKGNHASE